MDVFLMTAAAHVDISFDGVDSRHKIFLSRTDGTTAKPMQLFRHSPRFARGWGHCGLFRHNPARSANDKFRPDPMQTDNPIAQYRFGCESLDVAAARGWCESNANRLRALGASDIAITEPVEIVDGYWQCTCSFRATKAVLDAYNNPNPQ